MLKKILTATVFSAFALSACGSDSAQDVAVCANRVTGEILPDNACDNYSGSAFPEWMAYMYIQQAIYNAHMNDFGVGHTITHTQINNYHTTYAPPASDTRVATRDGVSRKANVYTAKQAGKPVKFNQDAKKISSVAGTKSYKPAKVDSNTYKTQSKKADNKLKSWGQSSSKSKPSYGTPSSYKPAKTGKCC